MFSICKIFLFKTWGCFFVFSNDILFEIIYEDVWEHCQCTAGTIILKLETASKLSSHFSMSIELPHSPHSKMSYARRATTFWHLTEVQIGKKDNFKLHTAAAVS